MTENKKATMNDVRVFFDMTLKDFRAEWAELNDSEKTFFKEAVENAS